MPSPYLESFFKDYTKQAAALSEPGGYTGPSTHPSAKADDSLVPLQTGSRYAENSADVKANEPLSVDSHGDASYQGGSGKQDQQQLNIGIDQSATGEDPAIEDDYKGTKDDPGTTSKMKADDGEKYSMLLKMPFQKLAGETSKLGHELLADVVAATAGTKSAAKAGNAAPVANATATTTQVTPEAKAAAVQAGYDAAALDEAAELIVNETIKEAALKAGLVVQYYQELFKAAADANDAASGDDGSGSGDPSSSSPPPHGGPGGPPPAGGDPSMGGMPPGIGAAMGGAPGMDAPPSAGGPPPTSAEAIQELTAAILEMGIDPHELVAAANAMQGGGPGGPPGGPGGMDMGKAAALLEQTTKIAHAVRAHRLSGNFRFEPVKTARQAEIRDTMRSEMLGFVREVLPALR